MVLSYMLRKSPTGDSVLLLRQSLSVINFLEALLSEELAMEYLRFVMENGAKGCEVIVSGKLRAKSMKFKDGYMICSGQPVSDYIDSAIRHVLLRQGVVGIKVKIMLDWDPKGLGPMTPLPDLVTIHPPKEEDEYVVPTTTSIELPAEIL